MDELNRLDQFDLGTDGDRHERDFWPLLSGRFPSYETLWRRLIVPLTLRIDPQIAGSPGGKRIRFRTGIPTKYEQTAMAHYSVFYFLGRAVKRFSDDEAAREYPEDILFLLDSAGDNFKRFLRAMNALGMDCGREVFGASVDQFPKGFNPFKEISDYRDIFLHNTVIGRGVGVGVGVGVGKTYLPKWDLDKSVSPLERAKRSWREAEQLSSDDLISTNALLERLIGEACSTVEGCWQKAVAAVTSHPFEQKMVSITGLADYLPLQIAVPSERDQPPSGSFSSLGSNTTFVVPSASGDYSASEVFKLDSFQK